MPITVLTRMAKHNCNGVITSFAFSFPIRDDADISVIVRDSSGVETVLVNPNNYNVTNLNATWANGGSVNTVTPTGDFDVPYAYPTGSTLVILRSTSQVQESSYEEGKKLSMSALEANLDNLTMMVQDLKDDISRCIHAPVSDPATTFALPDKLTRANMYLTFNADGEPTVSSGGSGGSGGEMVYPGIGIPLSAGTAWGSSIPNASSIWNTAYVERRQWDGGSTNLVAATARTSLGLVIGTDVLAPNGSAADLTDFPTFNQNTTGSAAKLAITNQATGDILYFDGTNWVRLAKDAGKYLQSGASAPAWAAGTATTAHAILSTTHSDSVGAITPVEGDLIYCNALPAWAALAKGAEGSILRAGADTIAYSTLTIPDTIAAGSIFAANTANILAPINSTAGTKYLQNAAGTVSWATVTLDDKTGWISVKDYGAVGNGTADDTAAVQAAIDAAHESLYGSISATVYFPPGTYKLTSSLNLHGNFNLRGCGLTSTLYTEANIRMITINVATAASYYCSIEDLSFVGNVAGTRTSNSGIYITGTTANIGPAYSTFRNLMFLGTYHCFYFDKNRNAGGEEGHDWNLFQGIKCTNYGTYIPEYGFHFYNGSGTGNLFSGLHLTVNAYGMRFDGTNGANIGDIMIHGIQTGGSTGYTGIYGSSAGAYRNNINITGYQFDAAATGVPTGLNFTNYSNITGSGVEGGWALHSLTNCTNVILIENGSVAYGEFKGTPVTVPYGGTGAATLTGLVKGNGTSAFTAITDNSANWDTAYTEVNNHHNAWNEAYDNRLYWDGGTGAWFNAATGRSSLGLGTAAQSATGDFAAAAHTHTSFAGFASTAAIVLNNNISLQGKNSSGTAKQLIDYAANDIIYIGYDAQSTIVLGNSATLDNPVSLRVGGAVKNVTIDANGFLKGV